MKFTADWKKLLTWEGWGYSGDRSQGDGGGDGKPRCGRQVSTVQLPKDTKRPGLTVDRYDNLTALNMNSLSASWIRTATKDEQESG